MALAIVTGDSRWANVRPLLVALSEEKGRALLDELGNVFRMQIEAFAELLGS